MQKEILNKFLNFKQKTLLSYADILSQNYFEEKNNLWSDSKELYNLLAELIKIYISNYYFVKNSKYVKEEEMSKGLNVLKEYYKESFDSIKEENQKTIYILVTVLFVVSRVDREITYYKHDGMLTDKIVKKLKELLKDEISELNISENHFLFNLLANKIKDRERKERQFFYKILENNFYINFYKLEDNLFLINKELEIPELGNYNQVIIDNVYKEYDLDIKLALEQLNLIFVSFIKLYTNGSTIPKLILEIPEAFLEEEKNVASLKQLLDYEFVKEDLYIAVKPKSIEKFKSIFKDYNNNELYIIIEEQEEYKEELKKYKIIIKNKEITDINNEYKITNDKPKKLDDLVYENIKEEAKDE